MIREDSLKQFEPLATAIHELLVHEWDRYRHDRPTASPDTYDTYIPAIHRLAMDRLSRDEDENIGHIAAYLNFVVKSYIGRIPDKALNLSVAKRIFHLAEKTRLRQSRLPNPLGRMAI